MVLHVLALLAFVISGMHALVFIDGDLQPKLPVAKGLVAVNPVDGGVAVALKNGIVVTWKRSDEITIHAPNEMQGKLCGLCGIFAGEGLAHAFGSNSKGTCNDDAPVGSEKCLHQQIGNSHTVLAEQSLRENYACNPTIPKEDDTCVKDLKKYSNAKRFCSGLQAKGGIYKHCHAKVDPDVFFDTCVADMCSGDEAAACAVYQAYERSCRDGGVTRMGTAVDRCGVCFGDNDCVPGNFGLAMVWSDPHVMTFDGMFFDFDGGCEYVLVRDKAPVPKFEVHVKNRNVGGMMMAFAIGIRIKGVTTDPGIELHLKSRVLVDNMFLDDIDYPYMLSDGTTIERDSAGDITVVIGKFRITILWTDLGAVTVEVPNQYKEKVMGLTGDFNGDAADDVPGFFSSGSSRTGIVWAGAEDWRADFDDMLWPSLANECEVTKTYAPTSSPSLKPTPSPLHIDDSHSPTTIPTSTSPTEAPTMKQPPPQRKRRQ